MITRSNAVIKYFLLAFVLVTLLSFYACQSKDATAGDGESSYLAEISLESVLGNGKPTLAEFGWRKCIPCKEMKPILEQLDVEYKGKLNVVIIEIPYHEDLSAKYGIKYMPTQIFFDKNGKELARNAGFLAKDRIVATLAAMGVE